MKNSIKIVFLATFILLVASCAKDENTPINNNQLTESDLAPLSVSESQFVYDIAFGAGKFAVDDDGIVYVGAYNRNGETIEHASRVDWQPKVIISAYNLNGELNAKCGVDFDMYDEVYVRNITTSEGKLFFTVVQSWDEILNGGKSDTIYMLDLASHEITEIRLPVTFNAIHKIEYHDDMIYALAEHPDYSGSTVLASIVVTAGTVEVIYDNLNSFSLDPNGNVVINAQNSNGWFFAKLDSRTWQMNEPKYTGVVQVDDMAADERGVFFSSISGERVFSFGLCYNALDSDSGTMIVLPDTRINQGRGTIEYVRGLCWYVSLENIGDSSFKTVLERINVSDYVSDPQAVKMLSSFAATNPEYTGFFLDRTRVTNEEMALAMLSQDSTNDVYLVSSEEVYAHNIREKGNFHLLNDVPYVQEYIDACFPFIRDAATDKDGNIWMLPIAVDVDCIMFHTENAEAAGLDFSGAETPSDILRLVLDVPDGRDDDFSFFISMFITEALLLSLREYGAIDTPEFRAFVEDFKEFIQSGGSSRDGAMSIPLENNPNFLFRHWMYMSTFSRHYYYDEIYDVIPVTGTSGSPSATCEFLVVNPYSDNIDAALDYISAIAQNMLGAKDTFLLADRDAYADMPFVHRLYELYESSTIDFNVPHEVFRYVVIDYLNGTNGITSVDIMIEEADRMLNMYLYE